MGPSGSGLDCLYIDVIDCPVGRWKKQREKVGIKVWHSFDFVVIITKN
jgi:hypothetical protein